MYEMVHCCCCIIEGASVGLSWFVAQYHIREISSFYTFSGGEGALPITGIPLVWKTVCIYSPGIPPGFRRHRLTVSIYFPRTPIPKTGLCEEANCLEISIALERWKTSAAFLPLTIFGNWDFYNLQPALPIRISWRFSEKYSGKALINSKRQVARISKQIIYDTVWNAFADQSRSK